MATANINPLVDAFAVAVWFPMSRRLQKTLSLGRTGDFTPRSVPHSASRSRGRKRGALLPFPEGGRVALPPTKSPRSSNLNNGAMPDSAPFGLIL